MIQLLHNTFVKSALFALLSFVLLFGSLFLGEKEVAAIINTPPPLTQAELSSIISVDWFPATDITSSSFQQYGTITITDRGNDTNSNPGEATWENRFIGNQLIIESTNNHRYEIAFKVQLQTNPPINIPRSSQTTGIQRLGLSQSAGMADNTRAFSILAGGLEANTAHPVGLYATVKGTRLNPAEAYVNAFFLLPAPSNRTVTTLPAGEGGAGATQSQDLNGATGFEAKFDSTIVCGIGPGENTSMTNCAITILYHVFYAASVFLLSMAGQLFDILTSLAISSGVYRDSTFVITGWSIVRDISNVFFIFVLLVAAFRLMFGQNVGQTIKNVIVVALLINFSLFMVRVVVDGTNVLAHLFYNRIAETGNIQDANDGVQNTQGASYELSEGITAGLNVQNFLAGPAAESFLQEVGQNRGTLTVIVLLSLIVNLVAAWMFFKVGWMMLGRIIGLWITMILAPLAFVLKLVPGAATYIEGLSFQKWLSDGIKYALLAPVFLFFVYLIILFVNSDFLGGFINSSTYEGFEKLILLSLSFLIILGILKMATDMAEKMSGEAGKAISGLATKAFGMAAGVAGGALMAGTGLALRQTVGRGAARLAANESLKDAEVAGGAKGWLAGRARDIGKYGEKSSFDARAGALGKGVGSGLSALGVKGVNFDNAAVGAIGGSVKGGKGGFAQARKDINKDRKERAKDLAVGPDSDLALDVYRAREEERRAHIALETMKDHLGENHPDITDPGGAQERYNNAKQELDRREGRMKRTTNRRKLDYADVVEKEDRMHGFRTGASQTADEIRKETGGKGKLAQVYSALGVDPDGGGDGNNNQNNNQGNNQNNQNNNQGNNNGPNASTGQTPQGAPQQPLPGSNQNIEKVLESTKPATAPAQPGANVIKSGEGERNVVGGFGQGLADMKAARAAEARERLATEKAVETSGEGARAKTEYRDVPGTTQKSGEATDTKDFRVAMAEMNATQDSSTKSTQSESTQKETQAVEKAAAAQTQEPVTAKIDTEQVKEAFSDVQSTLDSIEEGVGEVGENLGAVGEGLDSVAENFGEGLSAAADTATQAGEQMTKAVDTASEKERFRDMKGGKKQSADFKKMAEEIKGLKNSIDKKEEGSQGDKKPPLDNAA